MAQIDKPNLHFNTKLYTGTGSSNAITGVGFQPDWVWGKQRSGTNSYELYDAVRGVNKIIYSDLTDAEGTNSNGVSAFNADGFTVAGNTSINLSGQTVVAWNWKANGAGSSNYDGSITSTVSANTTAGFSIVKWTGTGANATVGHGLGSALDFIIVKIETQLINGVFIIDQEVQQNLFILMQPIQNLPHQVFGIIQNQHLLFFLLV